MHMGIGLSVKQRPSGYDGLASALFAQMGTQPDATRKALYNTLVQTLLANNVLQNLDILLVLCAHTSQASLLNLVNPAHAATTSGTITFTTDRGWAGDASSGLVNTGFDPSAAAHFSQNDNFMLVRANANPVSDATVNCGNSQFSLDLRHTSSGFSTRNANTVSDSYGAPSLSIRYGAMLRSVSTGYTGYGFSNAGTKSTLGTPTKDSATLVSENIYLGGRNVGGVLTNPGSHQHSFFAAGRLTTAQMDALVSALVTFGAAVGLS